MGEVFAGRYELVDPIGHGGVGAVWRAWDHRRRRYVAAKVLQQSDAFTLLRFVREQAVRIDHPHVLAPASWAADDDKVLFTMDLVRGGSLAHVIGDYGPLPPHYVCVLLDQLLSGLTAVHAEGVIHRDIKPANIMLEATGTGRPHLRLSDFGISMRKGEPRLTETNYVVGTPGYFAPEQLEGAEPDFPADLFTVGLVALYLLEGAKPDTKALVARFSEGTPRAPQGIPEPLWQVIATLLQPDPEARFRTSTGARKALAAAAELLPEPGPDDELVEIFDQLGPMPLGFGPDGPLRDDAAPRENTSSTTAPTAPAASETPAPDPAPGPAPGTSAPDPELPDALRHEASSHHRPSPTDEPAPSTNTPGPEPGPSTAPPTPAPATEAPPPPPEPSGQTAPADEASPAEDLPHSDAGTPTPSAHGDAHASSSEGPPAPSVTSANSPEPPAEFEDSLWQHSAPGLSTAPDLHHRAGPHHSVQPPPEHRQQRFHAHHAPYEEPPASQYDRYPEANEHSKYTEYTHDTDHRTDSFHTPHPTAHATPTTSTPPLGPDPSQAITTSVPYENAPTREYTAERPQVPYPAAPVSVTVPHTHPNHAGTATHTAPPRHRARPPRPGPPAKVAVPVLLLAAVCFAIGIWALTRI